MSTSARSSGAFITSEPSHSPPSLHLPHLFLRPRLSSAFRLIWKGGQGSHWILLPGNVGPGTLLTPDLACGVAEESLQL